MVERVPPGSRQGAMPNQKYKPFDRDQNDQKDQTVFYLQLKPLTQTNCCLGFFVQPEKKSILKEG